MIDTDTFKLEKIRAYAKYPDSLWSTLERHEMYAALKREVEELHSALWADDLDGDHGVLVETSHVVIVAMRIAEEMQRRGQSNV